jgi:hypothetical protein
LYSLAGASDPNNPAAGAIGSGGGYRIRVSPSGKVGVMWINDNRDLFNGPDEGIYFAESTDNGTTWPSSLVPIWASNQTQTDPNLQDAQLGPVYEMCDFWYDGEAPRFIYGLAASDLANSTYYPSTTSIMFSPDTGWSNTVPIVSAYLRSWMGHETQDTAAWMELAPAGSGIDYAGAPPIGWPTIARTSDPTHFAVVYQAYADGDTAIVGNIVGPRGADTAFSYGSIYYQQTTDGGQTWSAATQLLGNSGSGQKFDFRQPQTSDFNPGSQMKVLATVDTAPGFLYSNGMPSFDIQGYVIATGSLSVTPPGNIPGAMWAQGADGNFGTRALNSTTTKSFALVDTSGVDVTINSISFTGPDASEFKLDNLTLPTTIHSLARLDVPVIWSPIGSLGPRNATLTATVKVSETSTNTVSLTLSGVAADLAVRGAKAPTFDLSVWPNPIASTSSISIHSISNGVAEISVVDPLGRVRFAAPSAKITAGAITSIQLDPEMLGLSNGVYYVMATIDGATVTRQIIVSK